MRNVDKLIKKLEKEIKASEKIRKQKATRVRNKLMDMLNVMDEFACQSVEDNDNGEAQELEKAYNYLADYIENTK